MCNSFCVGSKLNNAVVESAMKLAKLRQTLEIQRSLSVQACKDLEKEFGVVMITATILRQLIAGEEIRLETLKSVL